MAEGRFTGMPRPMADGRLIVDYHLLAPQMSRGELVSMTPSSSEIATRIESVLAETSLKRNPPEDTVATVGVNTGKATEEGMMTVHIEVKHKPGVEARMVQTHEVNDMLEDLMQDTVDRRIRKKFDPDDSSRPFMLFRAE